MSQHPHPPPAPAAGRAGLALLLAASALLLLPSLGLHPLFDVDEGAFSEATREMLESGDWLSTTLNGAPRYDKPILIYWLQAACVGSLGLTEFALRLPSALAGLAWAWMVARFAMPRLGASTGLLAGWITATSLGVMAMSRAATADALLNALLVATIFDLWRHFEGGQRAPLLRAWLWAGLGVLAKGPIAIVIPAATALLFCTSERRWRDALRAGLHPMGWLVLGAVALPWYLAQWHVHGREFVEGFFVKHNLDRFGGPLEGHGGSLAYYFVVVPLLLLPWTGMLWKVARGAPALWRERGEPLPRYLLCWFGFVLVFFSLSGTKLPHYALYGATPLFLLVAQAATGSRGGGAATGAQGGASPASAPSCAGTAVTAVAFCLALLLAPMLAQAWSQSAQGARQAFYAAQAARAAGLASPLFYVITGACLALALALSLARFLPALARLAPAGRLALSAGACAVSFSFAFVPWAGAMLGAPVRDAGLLAARLGGPAVTWNIGAPSFSVYRQASTPARPPQAGELALTRTDRLDPRAPVDILLREGGVALVRMRAAAVPDGAAAPQ